MRAMETCKDERRENLVPYAPRRRPNRVQDDGSILPILQRLSRGHDAEYDANVAVPLPAARIDMEPQRAAYWPLLICSVLSAGVSAVVVVVAIGWIGFGASDDRQASAIDPNPKFVQTVTFKPANNQTVSAKQNKLSDPPPPAGGETRVAKDKPPEVAQDKPAADPKLESEAGSDARAEQMPAPSAANPTSLSSHGWQESSAAGQEPPPAKQASPPPKQESSSAEVAAPKSGETAGSGEAAKAAEPSRSGPPPSRSVAARHHSRRAHARRTHHARRHGPRQAQKPEPDASKEAETQASTGVLQSTWQTLFGHPEPPPSAPRAIAGDRGG